MDEFELFEQIRCRSKNAFDHLFRRYYTSLCRFSYAICLSKEDAEESIQEMFINLWEKAPSLQVDISVKAYLYTSARNYTLNAIQKKQTELRHLNEYAGLTEENDSDTPLDDSQISQLIRKGVNTLPEKCREIFILCKQEGLTYDEIAEYLNVSKKTVDNQMGIALRKLREYLHPQLQKILLALFFYLFF